MIITSDKSKHKNSNLPPTWTKCLALTSFSLGKS